MNKILPNWDMVGDIDMPPIGTSSLSPALGGTTLAPEQIPVSELDHHIARLLFLHNDIALECRGVDELQNMPTETKRLLLHDIYDVLGIKSTLSHKE